MATYPRKQTVFIFVACVLATSIAALFVYGDSWAKEGQPAVSQIAAEAIPAASSTAISADTDWQKQFLDAGMTTSAHGAKPVADAPEKLTATDVLGRNFFSQYMGLKQEGLTTDPNSVEGALNQAINKSASMISEPQLRSESDIHITKDSSATLIAYSNTIASIYKVYKDIPDEAAVAAQAFEDSDLSELIKLDPIITAYKNLATRVAALPVPNSLSAYHLQLLNGLDLLAYSTEAFRGLDKDPIKGFAAVRIDAIGSRGTSDAFTKIQEYLVQHNMPTNIK